MAAGVAEGAGAGVSPLSHPMSQASEAKGASATAARTIGSGRIMAREPIAIRVRRVPLAMRERSFHNALMSSPPEGVRTPPLAGGDQAGQAEKATADGKRVGAKSSSRAPRSKRPDAPPTSRLGRLARLGALAPRALPMAAEAMRRAMGGPRDEEDEQASRARILGSAKKTAEAMLKTLGEMKGLPLKLGQMASYIEGLAPPGYEEKFQSVLKRLQQKAPPLSREAPVRVIREELDGSPEDVFAEWEADPFAAASIGQVHRAITRGGERVAVKVQYPGIDKAIVNDLKSLSMLETMMAPLGRRYQSKETLDEIRAVFLAELDYRHEAEMAEVFRAIHADDADIVIPRVHHSLSTRRVLTCEMMGGVDYKTFCERAPQADRDAAGRTIWRFMFRALYEYGLLYADPHPGNYRFLGGGRVAFLDFGCTKKIPDALLVGMKRYVVAAQKGDEKEFERACIEVLGFDPSDEDSWRLYVDYTKMLLEPFVTDAPYRHTKAAAREAIAFLVRGGKKIVFKTGDNLPSLPTPVNMPSDFTFVNRLQWGLSSIMAGLESEANWRRITDPWLHGPVRALPSLTRARRATRAALARRSRGRRSENRLVRGDNLAAMRVAGVEGPWGSVRRGRVRCVYLDPPYNTGRSFAEYDDALSVDEWCAMMRPRLAAIRDLLADDGALFAEIDDTMLAPLHALLDETFGRANRVSTITIVRSASTGHKAINLGPVNVSDYLLVYAKDRRAWRANPQWRARDGYDAAYTTFVPNRDEPMEAWRFEPLRRHACHALGFAGPREARAAMGREALARGRSSASPWRTRSAWSASRSRAWRR